MKVPFSEKLKITVRVKSGFLQVTALNAEREKFYSARAKTGKAFQNILTPCPPLHRNDEHNLLCMHAKSVGILDKKYEFSSTTRMLLIRFKFRGIKNHYEAEQVLSTAKRRIPPSGVKNYVNTRI